MNVLKNGANAFGSLHFNCGSCADTDPNCLGAYTLPLPLNSGDKITLARQTNFALGSFIPCVVFSIIRIA